MSWRFKMMLALVQVMPSVLTSLLKLRVDRDLTLRLLRSSLNLELDIAFVRISDLIDCGDMFNK